MPVNANMPVRAPLNLNDFRAQVARAKVLDGELRLDRNDNTVLWKVNHGCWFMRLFRPHRSGPASTEENKAVRKALYRAVKDEVAGWQQTGETERERFLKTVREQLGIDERGNATDNSTGALTRVEVRRILDMVDLKRGDTDGQIKDRHEATSKRVGGEWGVHLTQYEFDQLMERAREKALEKYSGLSKDDLVRLTADYSAKFQRGELDELAWLFEPTGGDWGKHSTEDVIATHLKEVLRPNGSVDSHGEQGNQVKTELQDILPTDRKDVLKNNTFSDISIQEGAENVNQPDDANPPKLVQLKEFYADLILNVDPQELAKFDSMGSDRLFAVLKKHAAVFADLCKEVSEMYSADRQRPTKHLKTNSLFQPILNIGEDAFLALFKTVDGFLKDQAVGQVLNQEGGGIAHERVTAQLLQDNQQTLVTLLGQNDLENAIDVSLAKTFESIGGEDGLSEIVKEKLSVDDTRTDATLNDKLLAKLLKSRFDSLGAADRRKMLALYFRLTKGTANVDLATKLDLSLDDMNNEDIWKAIITYAGVMPVKLLQGHPEMVKANNEFATMLLHDMPNMSEADLKLELSKVRACDENIKEIKVVKQSLGTASIAQTVDCTIIYKDNTEKNVVLKLLKPEVNANFQSEKNRLQGSQGQEEPEDDLASIKHALVQSVGEELDFKHELTNCLLGLITYDEAGEDLIDMSLVTGDGINVSTKRKSLSKNVPLVLKTGKSMSELKRAIQDVYANYKQEISEPGGSFDRQELEKRVLKEAEKHCLFISSNVLIMEKVEDKTMAEFLSDSENEVSTLVEGSDTNALKAMKEKIIRAKKSLLVLSHKIATGAFSKDPAFFHGDLHGGNIMYNPDSGEFTLIDYGKGSVLKKGEKGAFGKMFAALSQAGRGGALEIVRAYKEVLQAEIEAWSAEKTDANAPDSPELTFLKKTQEKLQSDEAVRKLQDELEKILSVPTGDADSFLHLFGDRPNVKQDVVSKFRELLSRMGLAIPLTMFDFFGTISKISNSESVLDSQLKKVEDRLAEISEVKNHYPQEVKNQIAKNVNDLSFKVSGSKFKVSGVTITQENGMHWSVQKTDSLLKKRLGPYIADEAVCEIFDTQTVSFWSEGDGDKVPNISVLDSTGIEIELKLKDLQNKIKTEANAEKQDTAKLLNLFVSYKEQLTKLSVHLKGRGKENGSANAEKHLTEHFTKQVVEELKRMSRSVFSASYRRKFLVLNMLGEFKQPLKNLQDTTYGDQVAVILETYDNRIQGLIQAAEKKNKNGGEMDIEDLAKTLLGNNAAQMASGVLKGLDERIGSVDQQIATLKAILETEEQEKWTESKSLFNDLTTKVDLEMSRQIQSSDNPLDEKALDWFAQQPEQLRRLAIREVRGQFESKIKELDRQLEDLNVKKTALVESPEFAYATVDQAQDQNQAQLQKYDNQIKVIEDEKKELKECLERMASSEFKLGEGKAQGEGDEVDARIFRAVGPTAVEIKQKIDQNEIRTCDNTGTILNYVMRTAGDVKDGNRPESVKDVFDACNVKLGKGNENLARQIIDNASKEKKDNAPEEEKEPGSLVKAVEQYYADLLDGLEKNENSETVLYDREKVKRQLEAAEFGLRGHCKAMGIKDIDEDDIKLYARKLWIAQRTHICLADSIDNQGGLRKRANTNIHQSNALAESLRIVQGAPKLEFESLQEDDAEVDAESIEKELMFQDIDVGKENKEMAA